MATNTKTNYQLHLKGFVGGFDFDELPTSPEGFRRRI